MLKLLEEKAFDEVYDIMQGSFPPNERRSREKQRALLSKSRYKIYTIKDETANTLKAFIAVYEFEKFLFAEHFAVSFDYRNQGLGAKILKELIGITDKRICLEVEEPTTELACRRIEFYKRNGFFFNDYPYIQPSIEAGKEPIPLFIMSTKAPLTQAEFDDLKELVYKEVYEC